MSPLTLTITALAFLPRADAPPQQDARQQQEEVRGEAAVPAAEPASELIELKGRFVPTGGAEIALWPETWTQGLRLRKVVPHGTRVEEGQVIAEPDLRALDERIERAARELENAQQDLALAERRAEIAERSAAERLDRAKRDLDYARHDRKDFVEHEIPFRRASHDLAEMYAQHNIEDQEAELAQLEAMYSEDELTDATEEIVLYRSRRNLKRTRLNLDHDRDRRDHQQNVEWEMQRERLQDAARRASEQLAQLRADLDVDREERMLRLDRQRREVERKMEELGQLHHDRELLVVRAPRAGILLHGAPEDYGPGERPPRHGAGDALPLHRTAFTVAEPGALEVAFHCRESQLAALRDGGTAEIEPAFDPALARNGAFSVDPMPLADSAGAEEGRFAGRVVLPGAVDGAVPGMRVTVRVEGE